MSSIGHRFRRRTWVVALLLGGLLIQARPAVAAVGKCEAPGVVDLFCEAGKTAAGKAGEVVTAPVRVAAGGAVDILTEWVADSARWLLGKVIGFIDDSTSPDLGTGWFSERYRFMVGLGALVVLPMLLLASIRAVMNQDVSQLLRSFFVYLPVAVLGTFAAVFLVQSLLAVTDEMSAAVSGGIAGDATDIFESVREGLQIGPAPSAAPSFAVFFAALLLIIGAFFVWLELLVRSAAVTVSVFLLPLMLAALVWPATAHWTRRMVETLVALILSKFVIVAVISLATAALADPAGGGFGSVMGGAALMLMAAFSPLALLKLMPAADGGDASHMDGLGRKPVQTMRSGGSVNQALSIMRAKVGASGSPSTSVGTGVTAASAATTGTTGGATVLGTRASGGPHSRVGPKADRQGAVSRAQPSPADQDKNRVEATGGRISNTAPTRPRPDDKAHD